MGNLALFAAGLAVAVPAGTVVIALVFAASVDERAEKRGRTRDATTPPSM